MLLPGAESGEEGGQRRLRILWVVARVTLVCAVLSNAGRGSRPSRGSRPGLLTVHWFW